MASKKHNLRNRKGAFSAHCAYCNCPQGCGCSPSDPCFCGTMPDGTERKEVTK